MLEKARTLVAQQRALLLGGKAEELGATFDFPLAVQIDEDMLVFATAADLVAGVKLYSAEMLQMGVATTTARVTAIELPREGRFRIWADWDVVCDGQVEIGGKRAIYYCRACHAGVVPVTKIEMLQCTRFRKRRAIAPMKKLSLG